MGFAARLVVIARFGGGRIVLRGFLRLCENVTLHALLFPQFCANVIQRKEVIIVNCKFLRTRIA
jgi:hypothetical protein